MQFPHCDPRVVHSPTAGCRYCDESGLQQVREYWGINYTEETQDPTKQICPAIAARGFKNAQAWGGNRPGPQ